MRVRHSSHYRPPSNLTTFGDIPPIVVQKAFVYLSPLDLAATRLVCRDWNPTTHDVLMSRLRVGNDCQIVICGLLNLRRLIGFKSFSIKPRDKSGTRRVFLRDSYCCVRLSYHIQLKT
jgi:hypothetical protein